MYEIEKSRRFLVNPQELSATEMLSLSKTCILPDYVVRRKRYITKEFAGSTHGRRAKDLLPDKERIVDTLDMLFNTFEVVDVHSIDYSKGTSHITIRFPDIRFRCRSYVKYGEIFVQYQFFSEGAILKFYNIIQDYDGTDYLTFAFHPHISNGNACLGSWEAGIKQANNCVDLFNLTGIVRKFLNSYYGRSVYTHADYYRDGHRNQIISSYIYNNNREVIRCVKRHENTLLQKVREWVKVTQFNSHDMHFIKNIKEVMIEWHCDLTQAINILYRFVCHNAQITDYYEAKSVSSRETNETLMMIDRILMFNGRYAFYETRDLWQPKGVRPTKLRYRIPDTLRDRLVALESELKTISRPIIASARVATLDITIIKACIWNTKKKEFKQSWKIPEAIFNSITKPPENVKELREKADLEINRARKLITREMYQHLSKLAKGAFDEANHIDAPAKANQLSFDTIS